MSKDKKLNSRQKLFVVYLAGGMTQEQAYVKAGYSKLSAHQGASDLIRNYPKIKAELERLQSLQSLKALDAVTETVMAPLERRQRLSEIGRGRLVDFIDESGEPYLDKNTPNNAAAREYYHRTRTDRDGNVTVTKSIKLSDPVPAIQEQNKMGGDYAPSKHLVGQHIIFEVVHVEKKKREEEPGSVDDRSSADGVIDV